jgi:hypothetical protein
MTVEELCDRADLGDEAREMAGPDAALRAYVERLASGGRLRDAAAALAQLLSAKDAIAWGLESIRKSPESAAQRGAEEAMQAVETWLAGGGDEKRRAAMEAAERAGIGTPAGCLGVAVFFSGGSIAPPDTPVAPEPEPYLCGRMTAAALALAVALDPQRETDYFRGFVDSGVKKASDAKVWEEN